MYFWDKKANDYRQVRIGVARNSTGYCEIQFLNLHKLYSTFVLQKYWIFSSIGFNVCISNELTATHLRPSAQHVPYIPTAHQPLPGLTLPKGLATDVDILQVSDCVEVAIV